MLKHGHICTLAGAVLMAAMLSLAASAQGWRPERPVEIIVGTSAGGALDRTGRLLQRVLQEQMKDLYTAIGITKR